MTDTIKPRIGSLNLAVKDIDSDGYALILIGDLPKQIPNMRTASVAARYPVADIAAALGLATREELAAAWDQGRDAAHAELARMYASQCEGDCDCNVPQSNPYKEQR